mmetsp:Transcript_15281/g.45702  ORF Transcript_15281/g.45702 Transcript_15281/m.45702 type:complete len:494 (-) Transcript_15281:178-1659(-)
MQKAKREVVRVTVVAIGKERRSRRVPPSRERLPRVMGLQTTQIEPRRHDALLEVVAEDAHHAAERQARAVLGARLRVLPGFSLEAPLRLLLEDHRRRVVRGPTAVRDLEHRAVQVGGFDFGAQVDADAVALLVVRHTVLLALGRERRLDPNGGLVVPPTPLQAERTANAVHEQHVGVEERDRVGPRAGRVAGQRERDHLGRRARAVVSPVEVVHVAHGERRHRRKTVVLADGVGELEEVAPVEVVVGLVVAGVGLVRARDWFLADEELFHARVVALGEFPGQFFLFYTPKIMGAGAIQIHHLYLPLSCHIHAVLVTSIFMVSVPHLKVGLAGAAGEVAFWCILGRLSLFSFLFRANTGRTNGSRSKAASLTVRPGSRPSKPTVVAPSAASRSRRRRGASAAAALRSPRSRAPRAPRRTPVAAGRSSCRSGRPPRSRSRRRRPRRAFLVACAAGRRCCRRRGPRGGPPTRAGSRGPCAARARRGLWRTSSRRPP